MSSNAELSVRYSTPADGPSLPPSPANTNVQILRSEDNKVTEVVINSKRFSPLDFSKDANLSLALDGIRQCSRGTKVSLPLSAIYGVLFIVFLILLLTKVKGNGWTPTASAVMTGVGGVGLLWGLSLGAYSYFSGKRKKAELERTHNVSVEDLEQASKEVKSAVGEYVKLEIQKLELNYDEARIVLTEVLVKEPPNLKNRNDNDVIKYYRDTEPATFQDTQNNSHSLYVHYSVAQLTYRGQVPKINLEKIAQAKAIVNGFNRLGAQGAGEILIEIICGVKKQ